MTECYFDVVRTVMWHVCVPLFSSGYFARGDPGVCKWMGAHLLIFTVVTYYSEKSV